MQTPKEEIIESSGWHRDEQGRMTRQVSETVNRHGVDITGYEPAWHDNRDIRETPRGDVPETNANALQLLLKGRAQDDKRES